MTELEKLKNSIPGGRLVAASSAAISQRPSPVPLLAQQSEQQMTLPGGEQSSSMEVVQVPTPATSQNSISASQVLVSPDSKTLELQSCIASIERTKVEIERSLEARSYEFTKVHEIIDFMLRVQNLLWTENDATMIMLGYPIGPAPIRETQLAINTQSASSSGATQGGSVTSSAADPGSTAPGQDSYPKLSYVESMRYVSRNYDILLPIGMQVIVKAANNGGILTVSDVLQVIEAFRWMNWCNLTLHLLRFPPSSPLLKKTIDSARSLRFMDEKIIKLLEGIHSRIK